MENLTPKSIFIGLVSFILLLLVTSTTRSYLRLKCFFKQSKYNSGKEVEMMRTGLQLLAFSNEIVLFRTCLESFQEYSQEG